jgi:hypothetical protein
MHQKSLADLGQRFSETLPVEVFIDMILGNQSGFHRQCPANKFREVAALTQDKGNMCKTL